MQKKIVGLLLVFVLLLGFSMQINTVSTEKRPLKFFDSLSKVSTKNSAQETLSKIKDFLLQEEQWAFKKLKENMPGIDKELEEVFGKKDPYYKLDPASINLPCTKYRNHDIPPKIVKILDKVVQSRNVNPCIFQKILLDNYKKPIGIYYGFTLYYGFKSYDLVSQVDMLTISRELLNLPEEVFYVLFHYIASELTCLSSLKLRLITYGVRYNIKKLDTEHFTKILKAFNYAQYASNINKTLFGAFTNKKIAKKIGNSINIYATENKNINTPQSNNEIVIFDDAPICSDITKKWINIIWDAYQGTSYQELLPKMKTLTKKQRERLKQ